MLNKPTKKISFYWPFKNGGSTACSCSGILSTIEPGQSYMFTFMSRTRLFTARSHLVTACTCVCGQKGDGRIWGYDWRHPNNYSLYSLFVSLSCFPDFPYPPPPLLPVLIISGRSRQWTGKYPSRNKPTSAYYSPVSRLPWANKLIHE